ncbi:MAG TPA: tRNA 2-thiouridine(34) synthase MnmA [Clostridiales bacterium]|nr:tRNA 2-thiouridine(34) synthase MnmA [Clostridiales bacterium]
MGNKVMIAMSGGVDSSVAALVLLQQGYSVCGATLSLFSQEDAGICDTATRTCCSIADVEDARAVAYRLGFLHYVFNFGDHFRRDVMDRFAQGYASGQTPNPCLDCNRYIKFDRMLARARSLGMDYLATGHYARIRYNEATGRWQLYKAADPTKDQSYVLYTLTQDMLAHTLFPLGDMTKAQVRTLALEHDLINAQKPDSQDICFVPNGDYTSFLARTYGLTEQPGNFIDQEGRILGQHKGIIHYTIGQRKGLGISAPHPLYVVSKDPGTNTVVLGREEELYTTRFHVGDCNWISVEKPEDGMIVSVRTRYHQKETPARLYPTETGDILVETEEKLRAVTPGQAAVFYQGDAVVGGGTIL